MSKPATAALRNFLAVFLLAAWAPVAFALAPYMKGDKVSAGDVGAAMSAVEQKLTGAGFEVVGKYQPKGIKDGGVIVVTDKGILDAIRAIGGDAIVGAGMRVAVMGDGTVSYTNPEYWYRAYFNKNYDAHKAAVDAASQKLKQALGGGQGFGGDVAAGKLANYNYMFGMEHFDDNRELNKFGSFEQALQTVRGNLEKGVAGTSKVYEVVIPEKKIAVFGVAMNDSQKGDGAWVGKINGTENLAALPYEMFIVGDQAEALFGRYRIALGYPALTMMSFGKIMATPNNIKDTLKEVAGAKK